MGADATRLSPAPGGPSAGQAVALGAVQGPAELLPISSSAHLLLIPWLLGWRRVPRDAAMGNAFEVALHGGGAAAFLIAQRRVLADELRALNGRAAAAVALAAVPPGIVGYGLERRIEARLRGPGTIAAGLIAGSLAMLMADRRPQRRGVTDLVPADGLVLGLAQSAALVPGVSRNGASLAAARWRAFTRYDAHLLARTLALPIVFAATALKGRRLRQHGVEPRLRAPILAGMAASFASTLASRPLIARLEGDRPMWPYAAYRLGLAALVALRLAAERSRRTQEPWTVAPGASITPLPPSHTESR
jgi:undecaprenyl-diphosphatase